MKLCNLLVCSKTSGEQGTRTIKKNRLMVTKEVYIRMTFESPDSLNDLFCFSLNLGSELVEREANLLPVRGSRWG